MLLENEIFVAGFERVDLIEGLSWQVGQYYAYNLVSLYIYIYMLKTLGLIEVIDKNICICHNVKTGSGGSTKSRYK